MKMIYAIIHEFDDETVLEALTEKKVSVTKLASTGGFLRLGNVTLLIGAQEDQVDDIIQTIKSKCAPRKPIITTPVQTYGSMNYVPVPVTVDFGGATIFTVDVERFERI